VETHRKQYHAEINLHSIRDLVVYAIKNSIIQIEMPPQQLMNPPERCPHNGPSFRSNNPKERKVPGRNGLSIGSVFERQWLGSTPLLVAVLVVFFFAFV